TLPGVPTGQKQIAAVKATGQVTFTASCNGFACSIPIQAGTDVSTGSGTHYLTTRATTVQSTLFTCGTATVPVSAVDGGAPGNTESDTVHYVNNNKPDGLLSVTNKAAIGGGADARTATVIQDSDINSIRDAYS